MLTQEQVNKKYKGKYIEFTQTYDYTNKRWVYEVHRVRRQLRENTTLGEDVGTDWEYRR